MSDFPRILIIEDGGQLTLKIQKILQEEGYRSAILSPGKADAYLAQYPIDAIILSGGEASVYDESAPQIPERVWGVGKPVFGICYGMQAIAYHFGGIVRKEAGQFSSSARIRVIGDSPLFRNTSETQEVTVSHSDSVIEPPPGFGIYATRAGEGGIMAIAHEGQRYYGVQFHPETPESVHGRTILCNFAEIAGCVKDWRPQSLAQNIEDYLVREAGSDTVIMGMSGGVDSTTLGLLARCLGNQLHAITLDAGNLRIGEVKEIELHAQLADLSRHEVVNIRHLFECAFINTTDAEVERKIFQTNYTHALIDHAMRKGAKKIAQGTLAPDRIESGATGAAVIKTHHNVGNKWEPLIPLEPLGDLFKYEVRALARELGLPKSVWSRHPFPGPGEFLRVVGAPITFPRVDIVKWADKTGSDIIKRNGLWDELSQCPIAVFFGDKVTGQRSDGRSYEHLAVLRPVETSDFMTLKGKRLPHEVENEIMFEMARHPNLLGALFDYNSKPPRTTEFK